MITKTQYIFSKGYNPYENLALEAYLLEAVTPGECILYLWQNQNTVVIGRNQNAWKECKVHQLEQDGGHLVRRLSGGGAVFHDLGNLNFTFLMRKEDYDVERQLSVILEAVRALGIEAEKSGRNDIVVEGKKFSGNAFYQKGEAVYHHGTILIHVDMGKLSEYLNVSVDKLSSKGVNSVKSRVTNLKEYCPGLTIEQMKKALIVAFGKVYGCEAQAYDMATINTSRMDALFNEFSSWEWKYGKKIAFEYQLTKRFEWGDLDLQLHMDAGRVVDAVVYSDAMDGDLIGKIPGCFIGCPFSSEALANALTSLLPNPPIEDVKMWIKEQNF